MSDINNKKLDQILGALSEQLAARATAADLIVVGGSGLIAIGAVDRATSDVDVVALRAGDAIVRADPLPSDLLEASARVAADFGLAEDWLNAGPASLLDFGLPEGFLGRVTSKRYGEPLTVHFASRYDQIHLKLYALVDQGPGRHESDLRALEPSEAELLEAARWSQTHDPSEGYRSVLEQVLANLGVEHGNLGA